MPNKHPEDNVKLTSSHILEGTSAKEYILAIEYKQLILLTIQIQPPFNKKKKEAKTSKIECGNGVNVVEYIVMNKGNFSVSTYTVCCWFTEWFS